MKTKRTVLPATLMFALFLGSFTISAQSSTPYEASKLLNMKLFQPKKNVGLKYQQTLTQLEEVLKNDVNYKIEEGYKGNIEVEIMINPRGEVTSVTYGQAIPEALQSTLTETVMNQVYNPVTINGLAKSQSFRIPLSIK